MQINEVYQFSENNELCRIIEFDSKAIAVVSLYTVTCVPKWINREKFSLLEKELLIQLVDDPNIYNGNSLKFFDDDKLSTAERKRRDLAYHIVNEAWTRRKKQLLQSKTRNILFQELAKVNGVKVSYIRSIFSRYWQRGMTKNALIPDYRFSGGRGKGKNTKEHGMKVGSKKKIRNAQNQKMGIRTTDEIKGYIKEALYKIYYKKEHHSYKDAYMDLLDKHFSECRVINHLNNKAYFDPDRVITYNTFLYHVHKMDDMYEQINRREGTNIYYNKYRPLFGSSYSDVSGPGHKYQVDATIADLEIVSSITGNPIGRPVIYGLIDVYSRLVTGIYVSLAPESWIGFSMLLQNMVMDKVEFCKNLGIDITPEMWPSHHLPGIILGDNGPVNGKAANNLINNFGIQMEAAASFRGDMKGIVERSFRIYNDYTKQNFPGAVLRRSLERGERKPAESAYYQLDGFVKSIVLLVIDHNTNIINDLRRPVELVKAHVPAIPTEMWNWGVENQAGRLKTVTNMDWFNLCILPTEEATITREGISRRRLRYKPDRFDAENWEANRLGEKINISYDPRTTRVIYYAEDHHSVDVCALVNDDQSFSDNYIEEIDEKNDEENDQVTQALLERTAASIDLNSELKEIGVEEHKKTVSVRKYRSSNLSLTKSEERGLDRQKHDQAEMSLPYLSEQKKEEIKSFNVTKVKSENDRLQELQKEHYFKSEKE